jgi:hypothetical protein
MNDGDVHAPVYILKAMKIIPRPNITGLIMRLGLVKKSVAEDICTQIMICLHQTSVFLLSSRYYSVYLSLYRIYVYSMTSRITLYL